MLQASPPSPLPCAPAQQRLSISGSVAGEMGLMSCVLPEDLLVAILSERLQVRGLGANVPATERQAARYSLKRGRSTSAVGGVLGCVSGSWGEAADAISWQSMGKDQSLSELMPLEQRWLVSFDTWVY